MPTINLKETCGDVDLKSITAVPEAGTKDWQQSVTPELRSYFVQKLLVTIYQYSDTGTIQAEQKDKLITYAKKLEHDFFKESNSRAEYYHLLAEKTYKLSQAETVDDSIEEPNEPDK